MNPDHRLADLTLSFKNLTGNNTNTQNFMSIRAPNHGPDRILNIEVWQFMMSIVFVGECAGERCNVLTINVPLFKKLRDIIFFGGGESLYEPFRGTF
jgi:hypothetical protein